MDLFHFQEEAPGAVFWHPRGHCLFRKLEGKIREWAGKDGFQEVRTPILLDRTLWAQSGHWDLNGFKIYKIPEEGRTFGVKPVCCPAHIQIVQRMSPTWDQLPVRLSEFGNCHERDPLGVPEGLLRLIHFTVDDGHVFCREDQVVSEVATFAHSLLDFYRALAFPDIQVILTTRPEARLGAEATWDHAERTLARAADEAGIEIHAREGKGAFYGPRLDFHLTDSQGRSWMCGTLQLDLQLPGRFDLTYVDQGGERLQVVMLHRAMVGSLERFLGLLLEHTQGDLPAWLGGEPAWG